MGVGDNLGGLLCIMEWTSVLLRIQKKTVKQNTGKQRGRAAQQKITVDVSCFILLIFLKLKQTNDSPFRLLSSFPVKS